MCQDNLGNLFATSNLGVYKLNNYGANSVFNWIQIGLIDPASTEFFAIFFNSVNNTIMVSGENGVFDSFNNG
jgi:hypothetical protein